jgi:hypothetical protein
MVRQSPIVIALAAAVVIAANGMSFANTAAHDRANESHRDTRAPAAHEAPYQETGEIPQLAIG